MKIEKIDVDKLKMTIQENKYKSSLNIESIDVNNRILEHQDIVRYDKTNALARSLVTREITIIVRDYIYTEVQ